MVYQPNLTRNIDWTCLGLLSRCNKVCRGICLGLLSRCNKVCRVVLSYYLNYVVLIADSSTDRIFCFISLWHWPLAYGNENSHDQCMDTAYTPVKFQLNSLKIREKMPNNSPRLSSHDLGDRDLQPRSPKFISGRSLVKDYRPVNFEKRSDDKWHRNCWMTIFYFVPLWPWPLTFANQNVYSSSTSLSIYQLAKYEKDPIKNHREIVERSWR